MSQAGGISKIDHDLADAPYGSALTVDVQAGKVSISGVTTTVKDYNKTIELNSENSTLYNSRGYSYSKLGQYEKAIEDYEKAIELNPKYSTAYNNRGNSYQNLGKNEITALVVLFCFHFRYIIDLYVPLLI